MKIIGITGRMAAGKSTVSRYISQNFENTYIFDCDERCHSLLAGVDRSELASKVFSDDNERQRLENILWTELRSELEEEICNSQGKVDLFIIDAPLLFQAHFDTLCSSVIFITAPASVRLERYVERTSRSQDDFMLRDSIQEGFFRDFDFSKVALMLDTSQPDYAEKLQDFLNRL